MDIDIDFVFASEEILRGGYAWVGVSAQAVGITGDGVESPFGPGALGLQAWDPVRYGELTHPGDAFSYDIFSRVGAALRNPGAADPLGGLGVERLLATGESQGAFRLLTYANAVQPVAGVYDGIVIHSRNGSGAPLSGETMAGGEVPEAASIRTDLDIPVFQVVTETDLFELGSPFPPARQPDTDRIITWEVAGLAHSDAYYLSRLSEQGNAQFEGFLDLSAVLDQMNSGPQNYVMNAVLRHLDRWVAAGTLPPTAPPIETADGAIVRDADGIALGGLRTPHVDVPIATLTGEGLSVVGRTLPFDEATLFSLGEVIEQAATATGSWPTPRPATRRGEQARSDPDHVGAGLVRAGLEAGPASTPDERQVVQHPCGDLAPDPGRAAVGDPHELADRTGAQLQGGDEPAALLEAEHDRSSAAHRAGVVGQTVGQPSTPLCQLHRISRQDEPVLTEPVAVGDLDRGRVGESAGPRTGWSVTRCDERHGGKRIRRRGQGDDRIGPPLPGGARRRRRAIDRDRLRGLLLQIHDSACERQLGDQRERLDDRERTAESGDTTFDPQRVDGERGRRRLVGDRPEPAQLPDVVVAGPVLWWQPRPTRQHRGQLIGRDVVGQRHGQPQRPKVRRGPGRRAVVQRHPPGQRTSHPPCRRRAERDAGSVGGRPRSQDGRGPAGHVGNGAGAAAPREPGERERQRREQGPEVAAVAFGDVAEPPFRRFVEQHAGDAGAPPVRILPSCPGRPAQHGGQRLRLGAHVDAAVAAEHRDPDRDPTVAVFHARR